MKIKPIETSFMGYRFRSRLEARWAVFFQTLGVEFEYEPEGFDLGDDVKYLPDFRLRDVLIYKADKYVIGDLFVEVKGILTSSDIVKIERFSGGCYEVMKGDGVGRDHWECERPLLIVGDIPLDRYDLEIRHEEDFFFYSFSYIDDDNCLAIPTVKDGRFCLLDRDYWTVDRDCWVDGVEATEKAFQAARGARFEHGENGVIKE